MENFISIESSTSMICSMSRSFGALLCLSPNTELGSLSLPGTLASVCALYPLIGPTSMWPGAIQWVLLPVLCGVTPFISVHVAWPVQVQPRSGEREQPLFTSVLNVPVWPLIDEEQLCYLQESWFRPCILTLVPVRPSKAAEKDRDSHCHHMRHEAKEAKKAKKVQISTGRMNPHWH